MKRFKKDGTPTKAFLRFMRGHYYRTKFCDTFNIYDCYTNPSTSKIKAFEDILRKADSQVYILGYNTFNFTVAYFIYDDSLDTDLFVVETKDNIYIISEVYL